MVGPLCTPLDLLADRMELPVAQETNSIFLQAVTSARAAMVSVTTRRWRALAPEIRSAAPGERTPCVA